jgi:2,3-bisphosphoglycerate-independent phosphoglycerate mutase
MGLFSKGGVHSHSNHLYHILEYLKKSEIKNIYLHLFTDGRDCSPNESYNDISELLRFIKNSNIALASLSGRYYSMDRDNRWERIKLSYDAMVNGNGVMSDNVLSSIKDSYSKGVTDEFIKPIVCLNREGKPQALISEDDVLFSFNYRSDRMRQISKVLTQKDNVKFNMNKLNLRYLTMTNYKKEFNNIHVLFNKENIKNTLGEVLSNNSKKQLRIAETEKYPHVTFFFSGGREKEFNLERRILCKSPNVATYDLQPEMSAKELSLNFIREIEKESFDFACLNFANPDMVGHTGDFNAAVKACEVVDIEVSKIVDSAKKMGYTILITADHGNAEIMINPDGSPHTYHTTNLVPFILISENRNFKLQDGKLGDIAPTILELMNIPPPLEMTGFSLVK